MLDKINYAIANINTKKKQVNDIQNKIREEFKQLEKNKKELTIEKQNLIKHE